MSQKVKTKTLLLLAIYSLFFIFTRLSSFELVPSPHYDEAWFIDAYLMNRDQGLWTVFSKTFSFYSTPLHAAFFWLMDRFGIVLTFKAERLMYISFNYLIGLALVAYCAIRRVSFFSSAVIVLGFASLPLFVFGARSYLEVTVFHVLVMVLWLMALGVKKRGVGPLLCFVLALVGTLFHTLFLFGIYGVILTFFLLKDRAQNPVAKNISEKSIRWSLVGVAAALLKFELTKFNATIALAMLAGIAMLLFSKKISNYSKFSTKVLRFLAPVLVVIFVLLHWSGAWPYSHMTGQVALFGFVALLLIAGFILKDSRLIREIKEDKEVLFWLSCFSITALGVLFFTRKLYATRYWMLPGLFFLFLFARALQLFWNRSSEKKMLAGVLATFWALGNLVLFQYAFLERLVSEGPRPGQYRWLILKDDTSDYLPLEAVRRYANQKGCAARHFNLPTPTYDRMGPTLAIYGKTGANAANGCLLWVDALGNALPAQYKELGTGDGFRNFHVGVDTKSCQCLN